ncbi:YoaK family protein [Rhodoferax sp.]|uniref:YoaK family protein n=1 Tax=Rhodoferax sp. TaxID=50421 RepID=UPI00374C913E
MTMDKTHQAGLLAIGLGFVAGYVDTVGFVALFGLFTAHVTGNFVLIGSVLARSSGSVLLKLLVFPAFIAAVAATRVIQLWLERRGRTPLCPLLLLQTALLGGFMLLGWWATPIASPEAPLVLWAGILGATAMGVQNAAARLVLASQAPTTVMTGNVTQLVIDAVDWMRGAGDDALKQRFSKFLWPIAAFGGGAIAGAFAYVFSGFAALWLPMLVLASLAWLNWPQPASA